MITEVPRRYFNERSGHDYIQQLAFPDEVASIRVAVSGKFYAISAAAAALKHIEISYMRFALRSLRIKYQGSEGLFRCTDLCFINWPLVSETYFVGLTMTGRLDAD